MNPSPHTPGGERSRSVEVEWMTLSYRTIAIYVVLAFLLLLFIVYLISPSFVKRTAARVLQTVAANPAPSQAPVARKEAHFVNLDGTVRVQKAGSSQWIRADFNTSLEKGDIVQTASDGVARIIFADGTNYTLKPDALIVVEESREDPVTRATKVAVQVTSGAVDLATPAHFETPGSTSQVSFADAVASLNEESRAVVRNDPAKDVHEITVDSGQAAVTRGSTSIQLGQYEQVTFAAQQPGLLRNKVIAPPSLLTPPNMELKLVRDPKSTSLDFTWTQVPEAKAYHLQVSPSAILSNFVVDKKVSGKTSVTISGLEEGTYYWMVSAIDAKGVESEASQANRLNLVQEVAGSEAYLEVTNTVVHGKVVEVQGKTEPGSTVIINNEQVFSIQPDGTFRAFTAQLPTGSNQIAITAQDRKGNTKTIRKPVVIE